MLWFFLLLIVAVFFISFFVAKAANSTVSGDDEDDAELLESEAFNENRKKRIAKTVIVDSTSRKSAASGVARGLVGNAILGPVGALAGAGSAKSKGKTTFLVVYSDGSRDTQTVKTGGLLYKSYLQYLDV